VIGKYPVSNQQYADVLHWARDAARNYLRTDIGAVWTGVGDIYGGDNRQLAFAITTADSGIELLQGDFSPRVREGLPGGTEYSLAAHPVVRVTWFGAALFCNWQSERDGLQSVYNTSDWSADFSKNGYHLPTEAQWERAAAWDGAKHWRYGIISDELSGGARANYLNGASHVNPLGLSAFPGVYTAPVGWFDGVNISPNGGVQTLDSPGPVGAYDLCGNVWEWCHDRYGALYYESSPASDPTGPASGTNRVLRGGAWSSTLADLRAGRRTFNTPGVNANTFGFRLARTL
jgi:formylglycine-generating enzyme required for sulfatase activity